MSEISIVAAVASTGEVYFTLNKGPNNSLTVKLFLTKLIMALTSTDPDWRKNTVLLLDNARYHKSREMKKFYEGNHLPVAFLGPYHFEMAPVERLFSFMKVRDLNPKELTSLKQ